MDRSTRDKGVGEPILRAFPVTIWAPEGRKLCRIPGIDAGSLEGRTRNLRISPRPGAVFASRCRDDLPPIE